MQRSIVIWSFRLSWVWSELIWSWLGFELENGRGLEILAEEEAEEAEEAEAEEEQLLCNKIDETSSKNNLKKNN